MNAHSHNVVPPDPVSAGDPPSISPRTLLSALKAATGVQFSKPDDANYIPFSQDDQPVMVANVIWLFIHPDDMSEKMRNEMDSNIENMLKEAKISNEFLPLSYTFEGRFWSGREGASNSLILRIVADMIGEDWHKMVKRIYNEHHCGMSSGDWPESFACSDPTVTPRDEDHDCEWDGEPGSASWERVCKATRSVMAHCLDVLGRNARKYQVITTGDVL